MSDQGDLFGDNVVSSYTDRQAVEDGVLMDVSAFELKTPKGHPVNRITASIASMVGTPEEEEGVVAKDVLAARIEVLVKTCQKESDGWFIAEFTGGKKLWLIPNEVGGYTLMLPEDY